MARIDTLENALIPEEGEIFLETEFPGYFVSNYGRMYSYRQRYKTKIFTYQTIEPYENKKGYKVACIKSGDGQICISVHRLVYATFNSIKWSDFKRYKTIDHIDGNKANNRLDNLRLVTQTENVSYSWHEQGLHERQCKPVNKYGLDGRYISTYKSARVAVEDNADNEANVEALMMSIKTVCNGRKGRQSALGFQWRFADDVEPGVDINPCVDNPCLNRAKKVAQKTLDGQLIKVWKSTYKAGKDLGVNARCISAAARGKMKTAYGFKWEYV